VSEPIVWLTIFVLSVFVGIEVISKVSSTLHTPLMSGANAIHGVILLGAVLVTGFTNSTVTLAVGLVAVVLATINMVGGFVVTDRMLQMFTARRRPPPVESAETRPIQSAGTTTTGEPLAEPVETRRKGLARIRRGGTSQRPEGRP
jgi:H+-translocating NAD(P) transhydrogenase subunit alpha